MAFTRAQATGLLNKTEMGLYDDSRANALRGLDRAALAARIARARAARDRARDLLKRQRLAARKRGEGKADDIAARTAQKEALLVEILERFVQARRDAPAVAKKATKKVAKKVAKKTVTKKTAAKKAATKVARKQPAAKTGRKTAAKKTAKKAAKKTAKKAAGPVRKAAKKPAAGKAPARRTAARRRVSPEKALENTRRLLEAKHERDRTAQSWQALDPAVDHAPEPGYQSSQAARKAQELHAGEARMAPIHGSISTRDRRNQGKRDHRDGNGNSD